MKFANILIVSCLLAGTASATEGTFRCPSEGEFMDKFTELFKNAELVDVTSNPELANAYFKIWPRYTPNKVLHHTTATLDGQDFDIVGVKGSFIGRSGYLDAYTVVFPKGETAALATIQTDTDRSHYQCHAL